MSLESELVGALTDPTYGIPFVVALGLSVAVGWWSRYRSSPLPAITPGSAPEVWRLQLDALVYSNLTQGRYSAAVDGLGRCLAVAVRDRYKVRMSEPTELDDPEANLALPRPLTLRGLVQELNRAYSAAAWAEDPGWLATRLPWERKRQQRRAARAFAVLTAHVTTALNAFEVE